MKSYQKDGHSYGCILFGFSNSIFLANNIPKYPTNAADLLGKIFGH